MEAADRLLRTESVFNPILRWGDRLAFVWFVASGLSAWAWPTVEFARVPGTHAQPNGPVYDYRISRCEIRNDQFVGFLNDALSNLANARGQYMHFDADSGDVFIHSEALGVIDSDGSGTPLFRATQNPHVSFEIESGRYIVTDGFEGHPVTGVSWYGAIKYCNWLTLLYGMDDPDQRVYHEGPQQADWSADRSGEDLLQIHGFRLPQDDGSETASAYNEWYKAAAWIKASGQNMAYGFGRNTLAGADANYRASGDPFEPGSSPVGFFNGTHILADETNTRNTANGYGLYDLAGNVAEWMHDAGLGAADRAIRGGHFQNTATSTRLRTDVRGSIPADDALEYVGFRIVQVVEPVELEVTLSNARLLGTIGGPYAPEFVLLEIYNPSSQTIDAASVHVNPLWFDASINEAAKSSDIGDASEEGRYWIPPGRSLELALSPTTSAGVVGASPAPPAGDLVMIGAFDEQAGGPAYDYWIGRTEITNAQFTVFLNDALADALGPMSGLRSAHMYFDLTSGDVYVGANSAGASGSGPPTGAPGALLYDSAMGRIHVNGGVYFVESTFENHPVVGVTWYGAIKYCNWRSTQEGLPAEFNAYAEAPSARLSAWRPVVVPEESWQTYGLDDPFVNMRQQWVEDTLGYRLPMDDLADKESPYNEWYKAASRAGVDGMFAPLFEAVYGFGRDTLAPADANYWNSQDNATEGTTPVVFYGGGNFLYSQPRPCSDRASLTITRETGNGYGLYGMCGNVAEWTQDFGLDVADRSTRGGGWRDSGESPNLLASARRFQSPALAADDIGFRVVRGTGRIVNVTVSDEMLGVDYVRPLIVDLRNPIVVAPRTPMEATRGYGEPFAGASMAYTMTNESASLMEWEVEVDQPWVDAAAFPSGVDSGAVEPSATMDLLVEPNESADQLLPGLHTAKVTLRNMTTGRSQERLVRLNVEPAVAVLPEGDPVIRFTKIFGAPFDEIADESVVLWSLADLDLTFAIGVNQPWIHAEPLEFPNEPLGTLPSRAFRALTVGVLEPEVEVQVGLHAAELVFTLTAPTRDNQAHTVIRAVELNVLDPLVVEPVDDAWVPMPDPDPEIESDRVYALTNRGLSPIEVSVATDVDWIDLDTAEIELFPGDDRTQTVYASLNDKVLDLGDGAHEAAVTFENLVTGVTYCNEVMVVVNEQLDVSPRSDFVTTASVGGAVSPTYAVYRITNVSRDNGGTFQWRASVLADQADWLRLNGLSTLEGWLDDGKTQAVLVSINAPVVAALPAGMYEAVIVFSVDAQGVTYERRATLTVVAPHFVPRESVISSSVAQPNGPEYSYRLGTYHTTNAEYCAFLNDAMQNSDNVRGQYMFIHTTTGNVYANVAMNGALGGDLGGRSLLLFAPGVANQIAFDGGEYRVIDSPVNYANHPVTGVSWYGAVKYCNWLTIDQGLPAGARCYTESTDNDANAWRPVTVSGVDWAVRDLSDWQRQQLVANCRGFRLPMDDGAGNVDVTSDGADAYNEWLKAASSSQVEVAGEVGFGAVYGFGRSTLGGSDANFLDSGDPHDNGTTPTGYFDGTTKGNGFATNENRNGFGVFDLTGNAYQWMQGRFSTHPNSIAFRTVRGGSWRTPDDAPELRVDRRTFTAPGTTDDQIGFRVVRTLPLPNGDFDHDDDVDADDLLVAIDCLRGPVTATPDACASFDFSSNERVDLLDVAYFLSVYGDAE